jgi:hypothetical protein
MKTVKTAKKPIKKTKENTINKKPVGREPKYQPWMNDVAKRLAKEGKIDKEIYIILGISEVTGISYKKKYLEFLKSLTEGQRNINQEVENRLIDLALGYEYDAEKPIVVSDGNQIGSHVEIIKYKEKLHPNLGAIKEWNWNRNPNRWKNKQSIELSNENNEPFIIEIK